MSEFKETQRFKFIILPIILLHAGIGLLLANDLYKQLYLGQIDARKPMSDQGLILTTVFLNVLMLLVEWLFTKAKLEIRIDKTGLQYKYFPFIRAWKSLDQRDIESFEVGKYNALLDYGGWGYRRGGKKMGLCLNVWGNQGLKLRLTNGKKLLLGTQEPAKLAEAMNQMMNKTTYVA